MDEYRITNSTPTITVAEEEWLQFIEHGIPFTIYLTLLIILGTVGNTATIYVYGCKKQPSNCRTFILWIAVLDLLSCVVGMPEYIFRERYNYTYTLDGVCKTFVFIHYWLSCYSVLILDLIAVERYMKTCKLFERQISKTKAKWTCFGLGVFSLAVAIYPSQWVYGVAEVIRRRTGLIGHQCGIHGIHSGHAQIFFGIFGFFCIICLVFCIIMYSLIRNMLLKHKKENKELLTLTAPSSEENVNIHCTSNPHESRKRPYQFRKLLPQQSNTAHNYRKESAKPEGSTELKISPNGNFHSKATPNSNANSENGSGTSFDSHQMQEFRSSQEFHGDDMVNNSCEMDAFTSNLSSLENIKYESERSSTKEGVCTSRAVSKQSVRSASELMLHQIDRNISKSVKMTLIFFVVTALSYISAIPYITFMCIASIDPILFKQITAFLTPYENIVFLIHLLNYVVNPIVYCILDISYKKEIKFLFQCRKK